MRPGQASKKASLLQLAIAVCWSFFGIRKRCDYDADSAALRPRQVIVAGLVGAGVLVASLILLVRVVIGSLA